MNTDYEERWREQLRDYAPEARDGDWNAMQQLLPPERAGGRWWKAGALLLMLLAGWLTWIALPSPGITLTNFPVASSPAGGISARSLPPAARMPGRPLRQPVSSQGTSSRIPARVAPKPETPAPLRRDVVIVPTLGLPPPGLVTSVTADTDLRARLARLRVALPAESTPGANGYYPPTRIRQ